MQIRTRSATCTSFTIESSGDVETDLVDEAYRYITTKTYPPGCTANKKRTIRKKSQKFEVRDGEIFYKDFRKNSVGKKVCLIHLVISLI